VTWTFDGITQKRYINGILTNSSSACQGTPYNSAGDVYIGSRSADMYLNGLIDEVMIFNRSLTQQEITNLYNMNLSEVVI